MNPSLRVLHTHHGGVFGGIERVLVTLAIHGPNAGLEQEFVVCIDGHLAHELRRAGATVHITGPTRFMDRLAVRRSRARTIQIARDDAFDLNVCHAPWSRVIFGPALREIHLPIVTWRHGAARHNHWLEMLARRTLCIGEICNSTYTAQTVLARVPPHPVVVVHNPVSVQPSPPTSLRDTVRQNFATPTNHVVITTLGRIEEGKGHDVFLKSLTSLTDLSDWTAWIAGGPQTPTEKRLFQRLQHTVQQLGIADRVRFIGMVDDPSPLLAASDIYCQPSVMPEGFGMALIEAMWAGLPPVVTDAGATSEIVGDAGYVVRPNHAGDLAESLRKLIGDVQKRVEFGGQARDRALHHFNPDTQLVSIAQTLRNFLARS